MSAASELFAKARAALLVGAPFWGVLSLRLAPVEDPSIKTMETNGVTIRYNPDFVTGLSRGALRTLIAHETMHCAALHHTRREGRDLQRWNIACDYAINPLLAEAEFEMPEGVLLDPAYAGMSAEEIYDRLPQDAGGDGDSDDPGGMGGVSDPPPGGDDPGEPGEPGPEGPSVRKRTLRNDDSDNFPTILPRLAPISLNSLWRRYEPPVCCVQSLRAIRIARNVAIWIGVLHAANRGSNEGDDFACNTRRG